MSTETRLKEVLDTGRAVQVTFSNQKDVDKLAEDIQTVTGRIASTNTPDVVEFQPLHGAPVPIPVTRILLIE